MFQGLYKYQDFQDMKYQCKNMSSNNVVLEKQQYLHSLNLPLF